MKGKKQFCTGWGNYSGNFSITVYYNRSLPCCHPLELAYSGNPFGIEPLSAFVASRLHINAVWAHGCSIVHQMQHQVLLKLPGGGEGGNVLHIALNQRAGTYIICNLGRLQSASGIFPVSLFSLRSSCRRSKSFPSSFGICPLSLFLLILLHSTQTKLHAA